jgi:hypothetical chaperone protein
MKVGIGIDFGTSNSAAALFDGETVRGVEVDAAATVPGDVMPTALYLDRKLAATVGQPAIDRYIRENVGRTVTLRREEVGGLSISVADTDNTRTSRGDGIEMFAHVHAYTDQDQPGRLFRGVKRWLGNAKLDAVRVFDHRFRLVSLVTPILAYLVRSARASQSRHTAVYVGRPVHYEGVAPRADALASERMREACGHAGLGASLLWLEPIAATQSYLHDERDAQERIVLTYDFGGGTLDLSLIRARGEALEILATHGIGFGGDEINRMLYRAKLFPELGEGLDYRVPIVSETKRIAFPFERFAPRLLNWPLAFELNRPDLRETIVQGMRESPDARHRLGRLLELITRNRAYAVVQAIESAKLELSSHTHARIRDDELDLDVPVSRDELERLLDPWLDRIDAGIESLLARAALPAASVDVVVRTGGSSSIPAVIRRLEQRFPGRVVEHDRFTSIAAGLAIASFRGSGSGVVG